MILTDENQSTGEEHVSMPLCLPQTLHGLTRDRTRASTVRGRRFKKTLIVQCMER
jgi:hypothetical protein